MTSSSIASRPHRRAVCTLALAAALLGTGCRKGEGAGFTDFVPLTPSAAGAHGCDVAVDLDTMDVPAAVAVAFTVGASSQIAASRTSELLYATSADGDIVELDFSMGMLNETVLVQAATIVNDILMPAGIPAMAPRLSGIAVLDGSFLAVVEHESNTLLLVHRTLPDTVVLLAGVPDATGGYADGLGGQIRFNFAPFEAVQLVSTGPGPEFGGSLFVPDPGNHAIRLVIPGVLPQSNTISGSGAAGFDDGQLGQALFDTPSALSVSCAGELYVVESGASGQGGHRVRSLRVGTPSFFGSFQGAADTLAGDGTNATVEGVGTAASLSIPRALASTSAGEVLWVDSGSGALRRYDPGTGVVDCPLTGDCSAPGTFSATGGNFSLAITPGGTLYVLDGDQAMLFELVP